MGKVSLKINLEINMRILSARTQSTLKIAISTFKHTKLFLSLVPILLTLSNGWSISLSSSSKSPEPDSLSSESPDSTKTTA